MYPGGHGPMWDLAEDAHSIALIETMLAAGKPVAAVCHAPAVFRHPKAADGKSVVHGKKVTAFTNSEEEAVGLTKVVPYLLEDMLQANGAEFTKGPDWAPHTVTDGLVITGQNPGSSEAVAHALLKPATPPPDARSWARACSGDSQRDSLTWFTARREE
ncbi:class I glutamine amidotransferase-like protein [Pavlovales sp. CCMP2436]|nr:class I glutamine amidotransferase-like protein [Pavlovales sp. CCMP2436]